MLHEGGITALPYGQAKTVLAVARAQHSGDTPLYQSQCMGQSAE
jgi:hypothetical protein